MRLGSGRVYSRVWVRAQVALATRCKPLSWRKKQRAALQARLVGSASTDTPLEMSVSRSAWQRRGYGMAPPRVSRVCHASSRHRSADDAASAPRPARKSYARVKLVNDTTIRGDGVHWGRAGGVGASVAAQRAAAVTAQRRERGPTQAIKNVRVMTHCECSWRHEQPEQREQE